MRCSWGALPIFDIWHDRRYDNRGLTADEQCLSKPAGVHVVVVDPRSKEWDLPHPRSLAGVIRWTIAR